VSEMMRRAVLFVSVEVQEVSPKRCLARVELRCDSGKTYVGSAQGACAPSAVQRIVAEATVEAVLETVGGGKGSLSLTSVQIVEALGWSIVLVAIAHGDENRSLPLVGTCLVAGDATRAAALAVLNATNRLFGTG
jgi:hypothetical protein